MNISINSEIWLNKNPISQILMESYFLYDSFNLSDVQLNSTVDDELQSEFL